ncbi:MAG TPA: peptidase S41 [Alphaproteobacteria bacterium]|nr:peptidase S41 [Alphaproteobacteria bacterium]|tara:strand:- start:576 stop:1880 length:1305 start_codon:yes stop_codon:yes gene_type:complete
MTFISRHRFFVVTSFICILASGLFLAAPYTTRAQSNNDETYRQLTLFGDVFQRVRSDYVEQVSDQELIEAAINGMLTSLDPHSAYLPDDNFKKMQVQTKGKFGGLGIEVTMENGFVKVVSPIDDTPADKAGLQPEDLIISVDGVSIVGLTLNEAVEKLRGPIGSNVKIAVQRAQDEPFEVDITRDEIKIRSVRSRLYDSVGYVRITTFSEQTSPGLQKALDDLQAESSEGLTGLVIDLRNNPGGLLSEAIRVSDAFLEEGEIVSTRGRGESDIQHAYARPGDISDGLPIVVLINSGSASASEIVAGALKDHRRAIVMGTRSFGKGSVQTITPMPGHGAMRLTTARYFTPSGVSIQAKGISPDIEVALARIEKLEGGPVREEDLRGALDSKDESSASSEDTPEPPADPIEVDYQLARAIDLLRGLTVFSALAANS